MIFQTETQLKELGEKLSDEKSSCRICIDENGSPISNIPAVQTALDNINAAWKTATEAMYAQGEQGQDEASQKGSSRR
jgi:molecular chaperone DnaK